MSTSAIQHSHLVDLLDSFRASNLRTVLSTPASRSTRGQLSIMSRNPSALQNSCTDFGNLSIPANVSGVKSIPPTIAPSLRDAHRRLDRSVSEPVTSGDAQNNNVLNSQQQQQQPHSPAVNSSRYKTELCRPFDESGHCKYGDKCQFAHGIHELRTLARHPKYKTELCRTFHTVGFCPYGPRCHFIHNEDERKLNNLVNANQQANGTRPVAQQPTQQQLQQQQQARQCNAAVVRPARFPSSSVSSVGSSTDSKPSSLSSGSPTSLSPTFAGSEDLLTSSTCGGRCTPPGRCYSPVFNFNRDSVPSSSMMAPLNVHTHEVSIENLVRTLESIGVGDNEEVGTYFRLSSPVDSGAFTSSRPSSNGYGPSTPESTSGDSVSSSGDSGSPPLGLLGMKSSVACRLPIFDQFRSMC